MISKNEILKEQEEFLEKLKELKKLAERNEDKTIIEKYNSCFDELIKDQEYIVGLYKE